MSPTSPRVSGGVLADAPRWRRRVEALRAGLPVTAADQEIAAGRLTLAEIDRLVLPRKTLAHRRLSGQLTADQSDRLSRVTAILDLADETFGSREKAGRWLRRETGPLGGEAPLDLLDTGEGAREVERLLVAIGHGIAA